MAHRKATRKETDKRNTKVCKIAQNWLIKGFTPKQVADGVWNKLGNQATARHGFVLVSSQYWDGEKQTFVITTDKIQQFGQYGEALIALGLLGH